MGLGCLGAVFQFIVATFYLFVVFPITVFAAVVSWFIQLVSSFPWLFLLLGIGLLAIPWSKYHDRLHEQVEFGLRCRITPVWRTTVRPIYNLIRSIANPLLCWWNAINWFSMGYFNNTLVPTVIGCGPSPLILAALEVVNRFFMDFLVGFVISGNFLTGYFDMTAFNLAMIDTGNNFVAMLCCLCLDLCCLFQVQYFYLSNANAGKTIEHLINGVAALLQVLWRLIIQIITMQPIEPRPDFSEVFRFACLAGATLIRFAEQWIQFIWDKFVPWTFNWINFLCILDTVFCIIADSLDILIFVLIHIDIVFANMFGLPAPVDLWNTTIKDKIIRLANTWTMISHPPLAIDVGVVFGRRTVSECVCIFIRRIICDPSDTTTACFTDGGADFLSDFDFCCLTITALTLANDFLIGIYDMFLNVTGTEVWFRWLDTQPFTVILKDNIVKVAFCLLSVFRLVPVVGFCLQNIFGQLSRFVTCILEFLLRVVLGLGTLPYWLIVLGEDNFITRPGEALADWEAAIDVLVAETPDSLLNCLCYVMNFGLPIPPIILDGNGMIVPCGCEPVGFIPPTARSLLKLEEALDWSDDYLGYRFKRSNLNRVTPILRYGKSELEPNSTVTLNPIYLKERFLTNIDLYGISMIPPAMRDVDRFVDAKKAELQRKWAKMKSCYAAQMETERMRTEMPNVYNIRNLKHELPDHSACSMGGTFSKPGDLAHNRAVLAQGMYASYEPLAGRNRTFGRAQMLESYLTPEGVKRILDQEAAAKTEREQERLITRPPEPTVIGCPPIGDPLNPCFDLCCLIRANLKLVGHVLKFLARFINGLAQGFFQPTPWIYFIGDDCPNCFEQDVIQMVILIVDPLICVCRMVNLFFPVSDFNPRPDLCCALTLAADLISCMLQILVNFIRSLALDAPNFIYFNGGFFIADVDVLFDIILGIMSCLCDFIRFVFPIKQLTGGAFDPCCLAENYLLILVEVARWLLQIIINLATINGGGLAYWQGPLDTLGFVVQADVVWTALLGSPGGICSLQGFDQGIGGITQCICSILALIIPIRQDPGMPISDTNCPIFDICCLIREIGFLANKILMFLTRTLASVWQPWTDGLPQVFIDYIFCNEGVDPGCAELEPIIEGFITIVVDCPCQFFGLVDTWLSIAFGNFGCFCSPNEGFLVKIGVLVDSIIRAVVELIRRINDPTYWQIMPLDSPMFSLQQTWIFR